MVLLRSRLAQFLAIGAALFALAPSPDEDRRVALGEDEVAAAVAAQAVRDGARLSPARTAEVTGRLIEDEILYREGVRLGLDRDDPIVRQRVIQKVLLLAEDLGGANRAPTAVELRAEYEQHPERYTRPPRFHLMTVFASRAEDLPPAASLDPVRLPAAGEPLPVPRETTASRDELARTYGVELADAVAALPAGAGWSEPMRSTFGWHRVRVVEVVPGGARPFAEVAADVAFHFALSRREDAVARFLDDAARRYRITVGGTPVLDFEPPLRLARREVASGED